MQGEARESVQSRSFAVISQEMKSNSNPGSFEPKSHDPDGLWEEAE